MDETEDNLSRRKELIKINVSKTIGYVLACNVD